MSEKNTNEGNTSEKRIKEGNEPSSKRHRSMETGTQTLNDSLTLDKTTGILVILHDGPTTGNTSCVRFARICRTYNSQETSREIFNCKKFNSSKTIVRSAQCSADAHSITEDASIIHNDVKIGQSGLKGVYIIFPTAASNFSFQSTQTSDTTSETKTSTSLNNPVFNKTRRLSNPIETGGTYYLEPGIISMYVTEDERGIVEDMRFELKPPVIKYMSGSTQTTAMATESDGTSQQSTSPPITSPKLIIGATPPFILKYESIKYLSGSSYIVEEAAESTHPEEFPCKTWSKTTAASEESKKSDSPNTSQIIKNRTPNSITQRSFSMKLTYCRAKFEESSGLRIRTNVSLRTKLRAYVYSGSYENETNNRQDARNTLIKQPGFTSWVLPSETIPTELLTDSTGIRGVYVTYTCRDMQDLFSTSEQLFRIMFRRRDNEQNENVQK